MKTIIEKIFERNYISDVDHKTVWWIEYHQPKKKILITDYVRGKEKDNFFDSLEDAFDYIYITKKCANPKINFSNNIGQYFEDKQKGEA